MRGDLEETQILKIWFGAENQLFCAITQPGFLPSSMVLPGSKQTPTPTIFCRKAFFCP